MDLETVIQSEVSQKEKNKYRILTHICGIYKNGIDDLIWNTEIENKCMATKGERGVWEELGDWDWHIYTIDTMYKIDNEWEHTL